MGFVFGGKGGGGGASQANTADRLTDVQARLAQQLWDQTDPNRKVAIEQLGNVLGGQSPLAQSMFAPTRDLFEKQFTAQRQNILDTSPARGGQLNQALLNMQIQKPFQLAQLEAQTRLPLIEAGINTAFGAPSTSLQGLGQANQSALQGAQFGLNRRQSNLGNAKAFGQGAGQLLGTAGKAFL